MFVLILGLTLSGCAAKQKQATTKDENTAGYQYELAVVAQRYGLDDEAAKYLEYGLSLDPLHQPSWFLLSSLYIKKKDYARAEAALLKSLELKPGDAEAHTRLGIVYRETSAQDKAEAEFIKAFTIEGGSNSALNLAQHYFDRRKLETALEYAGFALEKDGRSVPGLNLRGVILNEMGRSAEAAACFEKILGLDPKNDVAAYNLAATYIRLDRTGEARDLLEKLLSRVTDPKLRDAIQTTLRSIEK